MLIITILATEDNFILYGIQSLILLDWKVYGGNIGCPQNSWSLDTMWYLISSIWYLIWSVWFPISAFSNIWYLGFDYLRHGGYIEKSPQITSQVLNGPLASSPMRLTCWKEKGWKHFSSCLYKLYILVDLSKGLLLGYDIVDVGGYDSDGDDITTLLNHHPNLHNWDQSEKHELR